MLLAALPRLWGLGSQPVLYFDSGAYLGEGAFLASVVQRAASAPDLAAIPRVLEQGTDAHPPDIAKPGHAVLLAIAILLLGKTVLAGALVSALAGMGAVAATYAIGRAGWNRRVAVVAAVLLAISGQHLVYSREPLVEADGLLFATLGALVYLRAESYGGLVVAGALYGVAFACNNRLSYLPLVLGMVELGCWPGWRRLVRRAFAVAGGLVAPLVVIQVAYLAARAIGRGAGVQTQWLDYVQQLATFSRMNPPDRLRFDEWPTYFVDVALMDGPLALALLLLGIVVLLARRRWSRADLLLAGSLLVPLVLYSVYSTGEVRMRHFSLALPWVMLAAALAVDRLVRLLAVRREAATALAVVVLVVLALPRTWALITAPSGMPAVLAYLQQRGVADVASTNGPVLSYFVGEARTNARLREAFVNTPADLDALAAQYDLLVVDMQAWVFPGELTQRYERAQPLLAVPNGNAAWYLGDVLEHDGVQWASWDRLLADLARGQQPASELRVYALRSL
ncbi:MAG TPA: glycosyltransferase family 39 protein [Chloroflexota bacterium]|nr:glycosyltransferase family 39 protein [Chloroflexota bacterium]